jgi:hypothetical protein
MVLVRDAVAPKMEEIVLIACRRKWVDVEIVLSVMVIRYHLSRLKMHPITILLLFQGMKLMKMFMFTKKEETSIAGKLGWTNSPL